jgi:hypothetical protein
MAEKGLRRSEMKRFVFGILLILLTATFAIADGYEAVTIAAASKELTATTYLIARSGLCRLETAPIRYTLDGSTVPTDTVGIILNPLEWIILENKDQIRNFRGFRTTGTSGSLKCFYFN